MRQRQAVAIAVLLALPLLCFFQAARQRGVFFVHDIQFYFYPIHKSAAALVKHGELPLWNPYAYGGMPLLGDIQTALLYPPNWLFFILPAETAFSYAVLLQFCLAGLGMYLFLRGLQLGAASSFQGAVAFMFCGFMTARVVHLSILGATALIPWVFLCSQRALRGGRALWKAAAAVAVALQVFSGHPQVPIYTAGALALFALVQGLEQRAGDGDARWLYRMPGRLLIILGLGYGLAAVQLLPLNELVGHSHRSGRLSYDFIFGNSSGINDWLLLLYPYAFGSLREGLYAAAPIVDPSLGSPLWEHASYVGILPLSLAALVIWCFASRLRARRAQAHTAASGLPSAETGHREAYASLHLWGFLVCLVGLSLLVASGRNTPFSYVLYHLPVLGKLRDMERAMVLADFALASLAAIGCELLWQERRPMPEPLRRRLQPIAIATLAVPALVLAVIRLPPVKGLLRPQVIENLVLTRWNALIPLALALASAGLLLWTARRGRPGAPLQALSVGLVLIDMGSFAASFNPTTDPRLYRQPPQVMAALDPQVESSHRGLFVSLRLSLAKMALTSAGLLGGLSLGREGPSVQVAAGVMLAARRWLPQRSAVTEQGLLVAGGAAGIAAAFNTPLGGVMFAIEELSRSPEQRNSGLIIAAIVLAGLVAVSLFGNGTYFGVIQVPALDISLLGPGVLVALVGGIAGGLFSRLLIGSLTGRSPDAASRWRARRPVLFAMACGLAVAVIGVASGGATFGSGYTYTRNLLEGAESTPVLHVALKFLATWLTAWSGVPGGIFAPALTIGASLGNDVAWLTGSAHAPALIALGMAAFLAAATQAPLTAFIIVMEMVDGHAMVLSLMACALVASGLSRLISRPLYATLARAQLERLPERATTPAAEHGPLHEPGGGVPTGPHP